MALSEFAFTEGLQLLPKLLYMRNDNFAYKFFVCFPYSVCKYNNVVPTTIKRFKIILF